MTASSRPSLALAAALLMGWAVVSPVVRAEQPTVKDLLGKAQTQSETKAVEDLVKKLERRQGPGQPPSPAPPQSASPAPPSTPPRDAPPAGPNAAQPPMDQAPPKAAPAETVEVPLVNNVPPNASHPSVATEPAPTPAPPTSEASADATQQMPSVELEVLFEYKSSRLTPAAVATLTPLGRALTDARLVDDFFLIAGHTDAKGSADYNVRLSQQRADAVRDFLIKQFKIQPARLVARGFGHRRLKDPQNPLDDKNRRVQVINFTPPKAQ